MNRVICCVIKYWFTDQLICALTLQEKYGVVLIGVINAIILIYLAFTFALTKS